MFSYKYRSCSPQTSSSPAILIRRLTSIRRARNDNLYSKLLDCQNGTWFQEWGSDRLKIQKHSRSDADIGAVLDIDAAEYGCYNRCLKRSACVKVYGGIETGARATQGARPSVPWAFHFKWLRKTWRAKGVPADGPARRCHRIGADWAAIVCCIRKIWYRKALVSRIIVTTEMRHLMQICLLLHFHGHAFFQTSGMKRHGANSSRWRCRLSSILGTNDNRMEVKLEVCFI